MKPLKILLVNLGHHTHIFPLVTPPFGLLALAAHIRERLSVEVRIVNQRLYNDSVEDLAQQAVAFDADVVGFSVFTTSSHMLPEACKALRAVLPECLVLVGGPHASADPGAVMQFPEVDATVPGEGESALEMMLQARLDSRDFSHVPGIFWRRFDGAVVANPGPLPLIEDLNDLPMPAYDLIDLPAYWHKQSMAPVVRRRYASLVTSRGCPYKCMWCHRIFGKQIRVVSPERIVEEIRYFNGKYGVVDFEFLDDNFNFYPERVLRFCELVQQTGLKLKFAFPNGLRADLLTPEISDALIEAGMYQVSFALETGSPRLQKFTAKHMDIPKLIAAAEHIAARNIYCNIFCMLGFPTETEEEIQQTIDVACKGPFHSASFYTVTPFPGTPLYDYVKERHPEKLAAISYEGKDFSGMAVNLTDIPDKVFFGYQRKAMRRFFLNPKRMYHLMRSHPQPLMLPAFIPIFLYRASKGLLRLPTQAAQPVPNEYCPGDGERP